MKQFGECSPESHALVFDINGKMIWFVFLPIIHLNLILMTIKCVYIGKPQLRHVCFFVHWLTLYTVHFILILLRNLIYLFNKGVVV